MRDLLRTLTLLNLSLFGGLSFANAPVANLDVATGTVAIQPIDPTPVASDAPSAVTTGTTQTQPVMNSQVLLSSLTPEQRIGRLENQVQYLSTYNTQLQNLSTEVDVLRGQIETLNYQVKLLKGQINTLTAANSSTPVAPASANTNAASTATTPATNVATTASNTSPTAKEQAAFDQAYAYLGKQQYTQATTAFNAFLTTYPNSSLSPDAHYWLGDLYLAQGQPDNASQQYRAVVSVQNASKRPDAMVKLGTILLAYGDSAHAKQLFQQVVEQYPNTSAATQAKTRLKSM